MSTFVLTNQKTPEAHRGSLKQVRNKFYVEASNKLETNMFLKHLFGMGEWAITKNVALSKERNDLRRRPI